VNKKLRRHEKIAAVETADRNNLITKLYEQAFQKSMQVLRSTTIGIVQPHLANEQNGPADDMDVYDLLALHPLNI
jgi:hypothetical protein